MDALSVCFFLFVFFNNLLWFGWNLSSYYAILKQIRHCFVRSVLLTLSFPSLHHLPKCPYTLRPLTISQPSCLRVNPTLLHHQAEPAVSAAPVCQLGCVFPSTVRPLSSQTVTSIQMSPLSTFKVTQCNQKVKMHDLVNKLLLILLRA